MLIILAICIFISALNFILIIFALNQIQDLIVIIENQNMKLKNHNPDSPGVEKAKVDQEIKWNKLKAAFIKPGNRWAKPN